MNFVEPIRDRKKIAQIKNQLRGQRRSRDLLLFVVGINTALRISDLLELQVGYFLDDHQHIKPRFWIKEQKRGQNLKRLIKHHLKKLRFCIQILIFRLNPTRTITFSTTCINL